MPTKNGNGNDNIAGALAEISDRLSRLVQDEIELAKAEVTTKAKSIARGTAAVAAGAVFGFFAVIFLLLTLAWVFDDLLVPGAGALWVGFLIVLAILVLLAVGAAVFAWRAFSVGAPTPNMAIDEGKKIKDTVTSFGGPANGKATAAKSATDYPSRSFAAVAGPAVAVGALVEPAAEPAAAAPTTPTSLPEVTPALPAPTPVATPEPETPAASAPVETPPAEPEASAASAASEPATAPTSGDEPTFVSVPEPEPTPTPTEDHPAAADDAPTLIGDQGTPETPAGDEPAYEIKPVHEDDDSTGAEK